MNILFHTEQIGERGTETALYDYALGNRNILGGGSFIAAPAARVFDQGVLKKFRDAFEVFLYRAPEELEPYVKEKSIGLFYRLVSGERENLPDLGVPVFIHCVFTTRERFGDYYCPVSDFINRYYRTGYPVLPHIVKKFPGLAGDLREELGIPRDAVVFGSYGGAGSFSIQFVKDTLVKTAEQRKGIYFLFMNFTPFAEGFPNIIFLPKNTDLAYKERFINTCDAMIHARSEGETFGLAVAEFAVKNKPCITWAPDILHNPLYCFKVFLKRLLGKNFGYARAHLDFLGNRALRYTGEKDLNDILLRFREKYLKPVNYDCYSERFGEERVMKIFKDIVEGAQP
jgi:hypothetical protein